MATSRAHLMTVAELEQLAEPAGVYYELHDGELVQMTRPIFDHLIAQKRLMVLLDAASKAGSAFVELSFRPLPEYQFWVADVAWATQERWAQVDRKGHLEGAPDIVIEVLSPSNTVSEMVAREQICLDNGCREFWIVDLDRKLVKVSKREGPAAFYHAGQRIPLYFAAGAELAVDEIFG